MISICIPVYNMKNKGVEFLKQALESLQTQTNKDFEVVVSDDSEDNYIEDFIENYSCELDINYFKNTSGKKGNSGNMNNAIRKARYEIIKPLFQDDWVVNDRMIEDIIDSKSKWGALGYKRSTGVICIPIWSNRILFAGNTIGMPSGIWFKKTEDTFFDENLNWYMDTEFYYKLYKLFGNPTILSNIYYIVRVWEGQISSIIDKKEISKKEILYIKDKYKKPLIIPLWYSVQFYNFSRQILRGKLISMGFLNRKK